MNRKCYPFGPCQHKFKRKFEPVDSSQKAFNLVFRGMRICRRSQSLMQCPRRLSWLGEEASVFANPLSTLISKQRCVKPPCFNPWFANSTV